MKSLFWFAGVALAVVFAFELGTTTSAQGSGVDPFSKEALATAAEATINCLISVVHALGINGG